MFIENQKILNAHNFDSILMNQKQFSSVANKKDANLNSALTLTSLVDCFTILVVYLLLATSIGVDELKITEKIALPTALGSNDSAASLQLQVSGEKYVLNEKSVSLSNLSAAMRELRTNQKYNSVVILADKNQNFGKLNPVVLAGLEAGFSNIKFAVQVEEGK
ncbi:MAG: biopolymer transporter ExbD [Bdellovibrionales bacterium]